MGKYFGTDGFRGEANCELTAEHAHKIGRFLGWYYGEQKRRAGVDEPARIVIGKDTRRSSYMFEYALVGGLVASGADAYLLHVTTTPSVAYVVRTDGFDCGVMISASHNPYYDNGIKLLNGNGEKMDEDTIELIESYLDNRFDIKNVALIDGKAAAEDRDESSSTDENSAETVAMLEGSLADGDSAVVHMSDGSSENMRVITEVPYAHREAIGRTVDYVSGRNRYLGYLISLGMYSFKGMKVGLDCANGSSWNIAKSVFDALGASTTVIHAEPDGTNINQDAGSTHIESLQRLVVEKGLDVGFAYDGDADRCLCVDENGKVVDGDAILYICGKYLKERGMLDNNTVVTTVMSNFGLYKAFDEAGISYAKTAVGDKYVYEYMTQHGCSLGGEQSGHIIFSKYATTGDGILTSLMMMEVMAAKKKKLAALCEGLTIYPQTLKNIRVKDKALAQADAKVQEAVKAVAERLGDSGRILVRESGTEPLVRVMVEAESKELCDAYVDEVIAVIQAQGHAL